MSNILALLKVTLKQNFFTQLGIKPKKKQTKSATTVVKYVFLFLLLIVVVGGQFSLLTYQLGSAAVNLGFMAVFSNLFTLIFVVLNFSFATGFVLSRLFFANDSKLWLPLPLKHTDIYLSRFILTVLSLYLFEAMFLLPSLIAFNIVYAPVFYIYLIQLIAFFSAPILFTSFFFIIFIILEQFVNIQKNQKLFQTIVLLLMSGVMFFFFFFFMNSSQGNIELEESEIYTQLFASLTDKIKPFAFIYNSFLLAFSKDGAPQLFLFFALALLACGLFFALAFMLAKHNYERILFVEGGGKKKHRKGKEKTYQQSSLYLTLVDREWKTLVRSPSFFFNTLIPPFLILIIMIPSSLIPLFLSEEGVMPFLQTGVFLEQNGIVILIVILAFIFFGSMNLVSATAISREGRHAPQLKKYPLSSAYLVHAKIFIGYISQVIINLILLLPLLIVARPPMIYWIFPLFLAFLVPLFFNYIMILFDLRYPNLNWNAEIEAVKNNKNVLVTIMIQFGFLLVLSLLFPFLLITQLTYLWTGIIFTLIFSALSYLCYRHIIKKASGLFHHL